MTEPSEAASAMKKLARHFPPGQVIRYLLVGAWNTFFGYGLYALFLFLLTSRTRSVYIAAILASVLGNVIAITVAFLGYKWFVFRTRGHYLREYLRCYVVYGTAFLANLALLPAMVAAFRAILGPAPSVPYIAGAVLTAGTVLVSFIGHRYFSFAVKNRPESI
jgi:putative flippase GtrA